MTKESFVEFLFADGSVCRVNFTDDGIVAEVWENESDIGRVDPIEYIELNDGTIIEGAAQ